MGKSLKVFIGLALLGHVAQTWSLNIPLNSSLNLAEPFLTSLSTSADAATEAAKQAGGQICATAIQGMIQDAEIRDSCGLIEIRKLLDAKTGKPSALVSAAKAPETAGGQVIVDLFLNMGGQTPLDPANKEQIPWQTASSLVAEGLCQKTCSSGAIGRLLELAKKCEKEAPTWATYMKILTLSYEPLKASLCQRQFFEDPVGDSCLERTLSFDFSSMTPLLESIKKPDDIDALCTTCNFEVAKKVFERYNSDTEYRDHLKDAWKELTPGGKNPFPASFAANMANVCSPNMGILPGAAIRPF